MRSKRAERKEKFDSEKTEINKGKKFSREQIEALQRSSKKTCEEVRSQIGEAERIYEQERIFKIQGFLGKANAGEIQ